MMRSVAKSPRVAEQCDVNIHSLTHSLKFTGIRKRGRRRLRWADTVESETLGKQKKTRGHFYGGIFKGRHWPTKGCLARYDDTILRSQNWVF
ncbi:hypothetical protein TNCV_3809761 [Trichonephila clavipes]|nr:hypothetical protein TNCV_3809761 [Trichonephila clavipes]